MNLSFKLNLLFLLHLVSLYNCFAKGKNAEYEVIKFGIPHAIWKQALRPTPPILKSPATVVVPIHIQGDEENELEDPEEEEEVTDNVEVDETLVNNEQVSEVIQNPVTVVQNPVTAVQDPVSAVQNPIATVSNVSQIQDAEVLPPQQNVPGQVIRFPCSCLSGQCGCCTGAILERFSMKACGNMSFIPEDFVFDVKLSVNNNTVVRRRVSASDPPPICFKPRRAPFVRVCAEISNIRVRNRNVNACLDINADIGGFPVYSASFRCFSFGSSGIKTGLKPKPVKSPGPKPVNLFGNSENQPTFIDNAAEAVLGGGGQGIFGGDGDILGGGDGGILGGGGDGGIFGGGGDGGIFGGGDGGLFGDGGSSEGGLFGGGGGDDGPLDGIGDALGDFLGRKLN